MTRRWLGLLAPLAALPIALGSGAGAATGWRTIGSGTVIQRRPQHVPWTNLSVTSTTKRDPVAVRVTYSDGDYTGRTKIGWIIDGFDADNPNLSWRTWGEGDYSLPKTLTWRFPSWVDYVMVNASASPGFGADTLHSVHLVMQARY
jgi:hypothetical protein